MSTLEIVVTLIGVLGTISSIFFAVLAFRRNDRGDHRDQGKNEGVLISDVGYIKSSIDRIEKSLAKLEEKSNLLEGRLIKVEEKSINLEKMIEEHIKNKGLHSKGGK